MVNRLSLESRMPTVVSRLRPAVERMLGRRRPALADDVDFLRLEHVPKHLLEVYVVVGEAAEVEVTHINRDVPTRWCRDESEEHLAGERIIHGVYARGSLEHAAHVHIEGLREIDESDRLR